jgi:4-hydroxy-tetrahydrodipicolinate reductase
MKNLAIVGYGKMGKLIGQLAPEYGFDLAQTMESRDAWIGFPGIDAVIEFSTPEAATANLIRLAEAGVPTVTGTTGWFDHLREVTAAFSKANGSLVWSPNFSVGVAVFRRLVEAAGQLLKDEAEYGAWAWEIHHDAKKDAPSGTLHHLVDALKAGGYARPVDIASNRAGKHPGTHEIGFDSAADTITLRHAARSREGFARGALKAARWILDHKGVFTFEEVLFGPKK